MEPYPVKDKESRGKIVSLENVSFRIGKSLVLSGLNWTLHEGENWAVLGPNAAGKSTFLRLVRGDLWPSPEIGGRVFYVDGSPQESPIRFRLRTGLVSSELLDLYRTQGWNLSGLETICTAFFHTPLLHEKPDPAQLQRAREIMTSLCMEELADRRILSMSLGQAKKVLIARALVHDPNVLFLDEACSGLDSFSRRTVLDLVQRTAESGVQILYVSHNMDDHPPCLTHGLRLESGRIAEQGELKRTSPREIRCEAIKLTRSQPVSTRGHARPQHEFLLQAKNVDVSLNGKKILTGINWSLKWGENWAVLGPNGSGKTTFLKLLAGELLPVWGGTISRFGGNCVRTLWDIRRRISFVSGDLQASFHCAQTCLELALSGFFGSIGLHDEPTPRQIAVARAWLEEFAIADWADRDVLTLSYGRLRMMLIVRAMVTQPAVLLLDEPVAGLDATAKENVLAMLDSLASKGTSVMYVTHHVSELVDSVTHVAFVDKGRLAFQGTKEEFRHWELFHPEGLFQRGHRGSATF